MISQGLGICGSITSNGQLASSWCTEPSGEMPYDAAVSGDLDLDGQATAALVSSDGQATANILPDGQQGATGMSYNYNITQSVLTAGGYRALHAGDHYNHKFTLNEDGSPFNLTGCKLWLTIKASKSDPDSAALLQFNSTDPTRLEITTAVSGIFYVHFLPADTDALEGTWYYDIQVKKVDGTIKTTFYGNIQFLQNITRYTS